MQCYLFVLQAQDTIVVASARSPPEAGHAISVAKVTLRVRRRMHVTGRVIFGTHAPVLCPEEHTHHSQEQSLTREAEYFKRLI
mgnify:CR=1 FL=1